MCVILFKITERMVKCHKKVTFNCFVYSQCQYTYTIFLIYDTSFHYITKQFALIDVTFSNVFYSTEDLRKLQIRFYFAFWWVIFWCHINSVLINWLSTCQLIIFDAILLCHFILICVWELIKSDVCQFLETIIQI